MVVPRETKMIRTIIDRNIKTLDRVQIGRLCFVCKDQLSCWKSEKTEREEKKGRLLYGRLHFCALTVVITIKPYFPVEYI